MTPLFTGYDAVLFDLDGVIYLGPEVIPGVRSTIAAVQQADKRCGYVTNNASRSPAAVAEHLNHLGIAATADDVVTSAQAAATLLADQLAPGSSVMVVGTQALVDEVASYGFRLVAGAADKPDAVVQGLHPDVSWAVLTDAAIAVQQGALWIAANTDTTKPGERGLEPGCGAAVAVVRSCVSVDPLVAGKPYAPLMEATMARLGCQRPLFVGDRLDTDIAGANTIGIDSLLVLSGAHRAADLLAAPPAQRPTHLGLDAAALLDSARSVIRTDTGWTCGSQHIRDTGGAWSLQMSGHDAQAWLDALWALAHAHWERPASAVLLDQLGPQPKVTHDRK